MKFDERETKLSALTVIPWSLLEGSVPARSSLSRLGTQRTLHAERESTLCKQLCKSGCRAITLLSWALVTYLQLIG